MVATGVITEAIEDMEAIIEGIIAEVIRAGSWVGVGSGVTGTDDMVAI
uniref:Uncharacterized protein n=1 Tax=viral metagenome TaxID=1070528 RepID=A0A6C0BMY7_9ZZZZ